MLISASLFLLLFSMPKALKNGEQERRTQRERQLEREKNKGVGSAEAADGKQKNRGPYLKSTIEIQDPYANSTVGGREKRKLEDRKRRKKEKLYIE